MVDKFFENKYPELETAEKEIAEQRAMVSRGRSIISEIEKLGIHENDTYAMETFFETYSLEDKKCYGAAKEYLEEINNSKEKVRSKLIQPITPVNQVITPAPSTVQPANTTLENALTLMGVLEIWINLRTNIQEGDKAWSKASLKKYPPQIKIMIELVGNPLAHEFTDIMLRDLYIPKIIMLPDRLNLKRVFQDKINGKLERKPIEDCFEIAEELNLKRISKKTVEDYVVNTSTFLQWAAKKKYITYGTEVVLEDLKDIAQADGRRKAFTEEELKILFETEEYQQGQLFDKPFRHWVPLIALYTGCRLGEASQLYVENILQSNEKWSNGTKAWMFEFTNEGDNQTIKGKGQQKRLVPIHKDLVKLGLIKYWEQQKSKAKKQLFSGLSPDGSGHWGRHISRWFNGEWSNGKRVEGYKEKYDVVTDKKRYITFHSFRHYVVNRSKQERTWDYEVWCEMTGHSSGQQTTRNKVYEADFNLDLKVKEMEKMSMKFLAINKIKKWS